MRRLIMNILRLGSDFTGVGIDILLSVFPSLAKSSKLMLVDCWQFGHESAAAA